ncbi:hypothetical protein CYY_002099 [Polysphondylium violaceum]|uniref:Carbohydrate binding domain-containing protein n=1 Tax=Polysphondylium violaceum TaxID=133409 RepID=A0A8J4PYN9_9MYCE|nr:hypothetical protein CYY_002099 [Polysphondylium violaceum]
MKIQSLLISFLVLALAVQFSNGLAVDKYSTPCQQYFAYFRYVSQNTNYCYSVSIVGLKANGEIESFKGHFHFSGADLAYKTIQPMVNLNASSVACNSKNKVQPFNSNSGSTLGNVILSLDGSITFKNKTFPLSCSFNELSYAYFVMDNTIYTLTLRAEGSACQTLGFGEACNAAVPVVPPASVYKQPINVTFSTQFLYNWRVDTVRTYQWGITVTNNEPFTISSIDFYSPNANPIDLWEITKGGEPNMYYLSGNILPNQSRTFSLTTTTPEPTFVVKSFRKA